MALMPALVLDTTSHLPDAHETVEWSPPWLRAGPPAKNGPMVGLALISWHPGQRLTNRVW